MLLAANVMVDVIASELIYQKHETWNFYSAWFAIECVAILLIINGLIELKWVILVAILMLCVYVIDVLWLNKMNNLRPISLFINLFGMLVFNFVLLRKLLSKGEFSTSNVKHWLLASNILYFGLAAQSLAAMLGTMHIGLQFSKAFYHLNNVAYALWAILLLIGIFKHNEKTNVME